MSVYPPSASGQFSLDDSAVAATIRVGRHVGPLEEGGDESFLEGGAAGASPGYAGRRGRHVASRWEMEDGDADADHSSAMKDLFGRGMLYTIVFAVQSAAAIVATPAITRLLGPANYGQVALILLAAQIITGVAGLGLQIGVQKEYAEPGGPAACRTLVSACTLCSIGITLVLAVTVALWAPVVGFHGYSSALELGVWWAGLSALGLTVASLLRARDQLGAFIAVIGLQFVGGQVIGIVFLLTRGRTPADYMAGLLIGQALGLCVGLIATRPTVTRGALAVTRRALAFSLPVVPHGLAFVVLAFGDRVIVRYDLGQAAAGRYQIAYNAGAVMILFLGMLNLAWEPRIFAINDSDRLARVLASSRNHLYRLQVPLLLTTVLAAPFLLRLLAPPSFHPERLLPVVALVAFAAFPFAAYLANLRVLLANRSTTPMLWVSPVAAVANIALNVLLVPVLGLEGSAIATLISYAALAALTGMVARRLLLVAPVPVDIWVIVGCAIGLATALAYVPASLPSMCIELAVAVGCGVWSAAVLRRILNPVDLAVPQENDGRYGRRLLTYAFFGGEG